MQKRKFNTSLGFPNMGPPPGRELPQVHPVRGKMMQGSTAPQPHKEYTGDQMLGISIIHKSCLQPVFSEQAARDVASMRR